MQIRSENWIKSLYQRSWEMELIICGFAIFLLLQVNDSFDYAHQWLNYYVDADSSIMHPLIKISLIITSIAVKTSLIFLIINLIFRAYWIALIGMLSSIKKPYGQFKFSSNRKQNLAQIKKARSIVNHIKAVDDLGSQIFSIAFLFIGYFTSALVMLLELAVIIFVVTYFDKHQLPMIEVAYFVLVGFSVLMLLYFFDLIFNGCISKISSNKFNRPYRHFERFMRYASLYFFYEKLALTVRRGSFANQIGTVIAVFCCIWLSFQVYSLHTTKFQEIENKYKVTKMGEMFIVDLSQHDKLHYLNMPAIPKTSFKSEPIELIIPLNHAFTRAFERQCLSDNVEKVTLDCISAQLNVLVNDAEIEPMLGFKYLKNMENNVIVAYIETDTLRTGKYTLTLDIKFVGQALTTDIWYFSSQ